MVYFKTIKIESTGTESLRYAVSSRKTEAELGATKSEGLLREVVKNASSLGMKVNPAKTKLLCVNADRSCKVRAVVNAESEEIWSGEH